MTRRAVIAAAFAVALTAAGLPAAAAEYTPRVTLLEAFLAVQPDQVTDAPCNPGQDCPTPTRSSLAGGLRFTYDRPGSFSVALTASLGHARDQERQPPEGFGTFQLRADLHIEISRGLHAFGLALRVSPVLITAWSDHDTAVRSDIPGLGLLLGRSDLWVEVGLPTLPTHDDPRFFSLTLAWRQPLFTLEGAFATFSTLTYVRGALDRAGAGPGVWLAARTRFTAASRWEATLRVVLGRLSSLVVGVGYHFGDLPAGAFE